MALPKNVPSFPRGNRLLDGGAVQGLTDLVASVQQQVTAKAGGTKAAATLLNSALVEISVCATNGDSVLLPLGYAGLEVCIYNAGAANAQVFGQGTDTINAVVTATGVTQNAGVTAIYKCVRVTGAGVGLWSRLLSA